MVSGDDLGACPLGDYPDKAFCHVFVLKLFFFPSFLKGKTEAEKQDYVGLELTNRMAE